MKPFTLTCPHCDQNTSFQPKTATQARWLELKSCLRSPQTGHLNSAISMIPGVEDDLRRCQDEIMRQQAYLVTLETQRKMLEKHLEATKALTAPIRRIPSEILGSIFAFYDFEIFVSNQFISTWGQKLVQVCSHWRNVALAEKQLWSEITFDFIAADPDEESTYSAESMTQIVQLALERSGNFPLTIKLARDGDDPTLRAAWLLVVSQCHRWRSLTVAISPGRDFDLWKARRDC
ncbi:hypothetical protein C8J56DRAFT_861135 [Mycena floridula]|nr:hypothetical protein C8J56DRAFT_861135 [Mycena floridula]